MRFIEKNTIKVKMYPKCLIYFLLNKKEVVYVGQTKNSISRPLQHKDKKYDEIMVLPVEEKMLDITEDYFITKYNPKYNKTINYNCRYSMLNARNKLREVSVKTLWFNGKEYISVDDFLKVLNNLEKKI